MAKILNGKVVNEKIAEELRAEILRAKKSQGLRPKLVIIQVGNLAESNAYIARKKAFGEKIGAIVDHVKFPEDVTQEKLQTTIYKLNADSTVHGIIVQMPLPAHLDKNKIIDAIIPVKDVDGLTSTNLKLLWENRPEGYIPATTKGILTLLNHYKIPIAGKNVVVVGRSFLVGKPTALAFINKDATVTIAHSKTKNLATVTKSADILVVAAGKPNLIGKEHVTKGQVVIDVGINVMENVIVIRHSRRSNLEKTAASLDKQSFSANKLGTRSDKSRKLVGDVDFENVKNIVAAISPVPGGIGPMTVASLFQNLLHAHKNQT